MDKENLKNLINETINIKKKIIKLNNKLDLTSKKTKEIIDTYNISDINKITNDLYYAIIETFKYSIKPNKRLHVSFEKIPSYPYPPYNLIINRNIFYIGYSNRPRISNFEIKRLSTDKENYIYYMDRYYEKQFRISINEILEKKVVDKEIFKKAVEFLHRASEIKITERNYKYNDNIIIYPEQEAYRSIIIYENESLNKITKNDIEKITESIIKFVENLKDKYQKHIELIKEINEFNLPNIIINKIESNYKNYE